MFTVCCVALQVLLVQAVVGRPPPPPPPPPSSPLAGKVNESSDVALSYLDFVSGMARVREVKWEGKGGRVWEGKGGKECGKDGFFMCVLVTSL